MRIGHGYDAHRMVEGRALILCGVKIPFEKGLLGHSDADAALHALIDSLLGALAMGDIGGLFPDSDPVFKDADSMALLREVMAMDEFKRHSISNIDITIVAQRPRLSAYIPAMRGRLAEALGIDAGCISVKSKTTEGMGFCGRGEGIEASAVCLLEEKRCPMLHSLTKESVHE